MADEQTNVPIWLWAYGRALEARYPDIRCRVERLTAEHSAGTGYTGWRLDFCGDEELLIRYGLVTADEIANERLPYGKSKRLVDAFGHHRFVLFRADGRLVLGVHVADFIPEGHWSERRVHTKKMAREVAKLLKRAFALPSRAPS